MFSKRHSAALTARHFSKWFFKFGTLDAAKQGGHNFAISGDCSPFMFKLIAKYEAAGGLTRSKVILLVEPTDSRVGCDRPSALVWGLSSCKHPH
jgi:hypothetical protein